MTWTKSLYETNTEPLKGVAYGRGLYVAVGGNSILTSSDCSTWTELKVDYDLWAVTYAKGLFVAVGAGAILSSSDGINWQLRYTKDQGFPSTPYYTVAYGSGFFVAGAYGRVATSTDGISWQLRRVGLEHIYGLAYNEVNRTFVAVAPWYDGGIAQSDPLDFPLIQTDPAEITIDVEADEPAAGSVVITNGGQGTLNWSIAGSVPWLQVSPSSGTNSGVVTVTANASNLNNGTYSGVLTISSAGAGNSPQSISVKLNVNKPVIAVSPAALAFGSVKEGVQSSQTVTIQNKGGGNLQISSAALTGISQFSIIHDNCTGQTLSSKSSCSIDISFAPDQAGPKAATLIVTSNDPHNPKVSVPITGKGTLPGAIYGDLADAENNPLAEADLVLSPDPEANDTTSSYSAQSDADGKFRIDNMDAGTYIITAFKAGYAKKTDTLVLTPSQETYMQFQLLIPVFEVQSVRTQYRGHPYFIDGIDHTVKFTADVSWGEHEPGYVRFVPPSGWAYDVPTKYTTASQGFNVGRDFGPCGKLRVVAVSADGSVSDVKEADFTVMKGVPLATLEFREGGWGQSEFSYKATDLFNVSLIKAGADLGIIPNQIPLFGGQSFALESIPALNARVEGNRVKYATDKNLLDTKGSLAGFGYHLNGNLYLTGDFSNSACEWDWDGQFDIGGKAAIQAVWPFSAGPVPMYLRALLELATDNKLTIKDINPFSLAGQVEIKPDVRGAVGVGVSDVISAEAWIGGGSDMQLQWPAEPTLNNLSVYLNAGAAVEVFGFMLEKELWKWDWKLGESSAASFLQNVKKLTTPSLLSRDYLDKLNYAHFIGQNRFATRSALEAGKTSASATSPVQITVRPDSQPSISAQGSNVYLTWLYDNPAKAAINGTTAVFSSWNESGWREPVPISDDGTADYHPHILTFADGAAITAWEDQNSVLPDSATLEDFKQGLEVSVAVYNPSTSTWQSQRLTANGYLDRSPKLSGKTKDMVMLTWIANEANDLWGSSAMPNSLWYSLFNGISWSTPMKALDLPYGVVKYSMVYYYDNGTNISAASAVFSVDKDGDPATDSDRELFSAWFDSAGQQWDSFLITSDNLPDENPQQNVDAAGNWLMTWTKGGKLYYWPDYQSPAVAFDGGGSSSGVSDAKLISSANGKLALVWAEPSQYSSDLYALFYDGKGGWGKPRQLTFDQETESHVAATFFGEKTIIAAYNRNTIGFNETRQTAQNGMTFAVSEPVKVNTDLYMLKHTMETDLSLKAGSLVANQENPLPGQDIALSVAVLNNGDTAVTDVAVAFYLGDPALGGVQIGQGNIPGSFGPGSEVEVQIPWTVPDTTKPLAIYAIIDPAATFDTANRTDNTVSTELIKADLAVSNLRWEKMNGNFISITARITNSGPIPSAATIVTFRSNGPSGQILAHLDLKALAGGQSAELNYVPDLSADRQPRYAIYVSVDEAGVVNDMDRTNNTAWFTIEGNVPAISVIPSVYSFGPLNSGEQQSQDFTVTNTGTADLLIGTVTVTGATEFSVSSDSCSNRNIPASKSCVVQALFKSSTGNVSAVLQVPSTAINNPVQASLHGTGAVLASLMGDINGDGWVDLMDAILSLQILAARPSAGVRPDFPSSGVDVNGDKRIGLGEVLYILQKVAGMR